MFKKIAMFALMPALMLSCGGQKTYRFVGRVFDGVTGAQIKNYKIETLYSAARGQGSVDKDGRYVSIEIPSGHDFTMVVTGPNTYRAFYSVNSALGDFGRANNFGGTARSGNTYNNSNSNSEPAYPRSYNLQETMNYDVYLFPTAVQSPELKVDLFFTDKQERPAAGTVRFVPTSSTSNLQATPGAVNTFANTADLQFGTVSVALANGQATVAAGALVYGVTYRMDVFGVQGYQTALGTTVVAGADHSREVYLQPLVENDALAVVFTNGRRGLAADGSGKLTVVFNQRVEFATGVRSVAGMAHDLANDNFLNTPTYTYYQDGQGADVAFRTDVFATPDNGESNNCGVAIALDSTSTVLEVTFNLAQCLTGTGANAGTAGDGIAIDWDLKTVFVRALDRGANAAPVALDGGVNLATGGSANLNAARIIVRSASNAQIPASL